MSEIKILKTPEEVFSQEILELGIMEHISNVNNVLSIEVNKNNELVIFYKKNPFNFIPSLNHHKDTLDIKSPLIYNGMGCETLDRGQLSLNYKSYVKFFITSTIDAKRIKKSIKKMKEAQNEKWRNDKEELGIVTFDDLSRTIILGLHNLNKYTKSLKGKERNISYSIKHKILSNLLVNINHITHIYRQDVNGQTMALLCTDIPKPNCLDVDISFHMPLNKINIDHYDLPFADNTYNGGDTSQDIDEKLVNFIIEHKDHIISITSNTGDYKYGK